MLFLAIVSGIVSDILLDILTASVVLLEPKTIDATPYLCASQSLCYGRGGVELEALSKSLCGMTWVNRGCWA